MNPEAGRTTDADPAGTETSRLAKWATVLIGGEGVLLLLVTVLGAMARIDAPLAYVAAFALAILIGGRLGGVRGAVQWVVAAVLIVAVAFALLYAFIVVAVSQITGP